MIGTAPQGFATVGPSAATGALASADQGADVALNRFSIDALALIAARLGLGSPRVAGRLGLGSARVAGRLGLGSARVAARLGLGSTRAGDPSAREAGGAGGLAATGIGR